MTGRELRINPSARHAIRSRGAKRSAAVYHLSGNLPDCDGVEHLPSKVEDTWPNFFIVGAPKAGTTSLYAYLAQHPQVFMPAVKEPQYFAQVRPSAEFEHLVEAIADQRSYLRLYRRARGYNAIGDASPSYLWHPEVPGRIKRVAPEARIIIALRDPIERAHSHYLADFREGTESLAFDAALRNDLARSRKGLGVSHMYVEFGQYAAQVGRYLDVFGPERVHLLLFDDLRTSASHAVAGICRFLGLDAAPAADIDTARVHNGFAAPRWEWTRRVAGRRWARRLGQSVVPRSIGAFIFERLFNRPGVKPAIDPRAKELMLPIYEPDVLRLESMLGRTLSELRRSW
jgi:Sulfotransferase family